MKVYRGFTSLAMATILALTACQSKPELQIKGTSLPSDLDGAVVKVYEEIRESNVHIYDVPAIDSTVIETGAFELKLSATDVKPALLKIGKQEALNFFTEPGKLEVTPILNDEGAVVKYQFAGSPTLLTIQYQEIASDIAALEQPIHERTVALNKEMSAAGKPTEEHFRRAMALQEEYANVVNKRVKELYDEHKDDPIGVLLFNKIRFATDENDNDTEFVAAYEAASDQVKETKNFKERYDSAIKALNTSTGHPYVDFEMDNGEGEVRKLSSFMEEGSYLLIDFFASWCGPCRWAMPEIAKLQEKYKDHGVKVLSIGTWEKFGNDDPEIALANHKKAVEKLEITWDHFYDSENAGVTEYGVRGIPALVLISPEGEIVARTSSVQEIAAKLEELIPF